jgi:hypothetical protein
LAVAGEYITCHNDRRPNQATDAGVWWHKKADTWKEPTKVEQPVSSFWCSFIILFFQNNESDY